MIKRTLTVFFASVLLIFAFSAESKAQKIGHVNFQELISLMPGQDTIMKQLQDYQTSLSNQLGAMYGEMETKMADYQANVGSLSNIVKQTKEKEINDLRARIGDFEQNAQDDLMGKQNELYAPLIKKAKEACNAIAKENGYKYILNNNENIIIYCEPTDDILPLVKKRLKLPDVPQVPK